MNEETAQVAKTIGARCRELTARLEQSEHEEGGFDAGATLVLLANVGRLEVLGLTLELAMSHNGLLVRATEALFRSRALDLSPLEGYAMELAALLPRWMSAPDDPELRADVESKLRLAFRLREHWHLVDRAARWILGGPPPIDPWQEAFVHEFDLVLRPHLPVIAAFSEMRAREGAWVPEVEREAFWWWFGGASGRA